VSDLSAKFNQRVTDLVHEYWSGQQAMTTAITELEERLMKAAAASESAAPSASMISALNEVKQNFQLRLFELASQSARELHDVEASIKATMRADLSQLAHSGSVRALEDKVAELQLQARLQDEKIDRLETRLDLQELQHMQQVCAIQISVQNRLDDVLARSRILSEFVHG
jgi:PPE-repeat protein